MSRFMCALALMAVAAGSLLAQEIPAPATPGPEHKHLHTLEGTWDCKMKMEGAPEALNAVATYKIELGGLWVSSEFKCDNPGFKFTGKGLDGYDTNKNKYVGTWCDSMSTSMMVMEGTHDEKTKTTTMTGQGYNEQGKLTKYRNVTKETDADHFTFQMYMVGDDGKESLAFTIDYTRRK
jgi:hypothetical protein